MILEIEQDKLKTIKVVSPRLARPRQSIVANLRQMFRAMRVNLRRSV